MPTHDLGSPFPHAPPSPTRHNGSTGLQAPPNSPTGRPDIPPQVIEASINLQSVLGFQPSRSEYPPVFQAGAQPGVPVASNYPFQFGVQPGASMASNHPFQFRPQPEVLAASYHPFQLGAQPEVLAASNYPFQFGAQRAFQPGFHPYFPNGIGAGVIQNVAAPNGMPNNIPFGPSPFGLSQMTNPHEPYTHDGVFRHYNPHHHAYPPSAMYHPHGFHPHPGMFHPNVAMNNGGPNTNHYPISPAFQNWIDSLRDNETEPEPDGLEDAEDDYDSDDQEPFLGFTIEDPNQMIRGLASRDITCPRDLIDCSPSCPYTHLDVISPEAALRRRQAREAAALDSAQSDPPTPDSETGDENKENIPPMMG